MEGKFIFWDFDLKKHYKTDEVTQMSATDITNAAQCEYKLYYKFTKACKIPPNIYLVMGSVFHEVIEKDLKHKVKCGANMEWNELSMLFEDVWKKQIQKITDFGKFSEGQAKAMCLNYVKVYSVKMSPMLYPLANSEREIEKFFCVYVNYGTKRLGLTGKVDMVGKDFWITDHKTSSKKWTQEDADNELQAQIYPFCLNSLGYPIRGFKFNVVDKNKVEVFLVEYDKKKVKNILREAFAVKQRIEDNVMLKAKTAQTCKWCEYASVCTEN